MPAATFDKSQGVTVGLSTNTTFSIKPMDWDWTGYKATELDSTALSDLVYKTADKGLTDPGEVSFNFKMELDKLKVNFQAVEASAIQNLTLTFLASGTYATRLLVVPIFCSAFTWKGATDTHMEGSITFKVTGAPTITLNV